MVLLRQFNNSIKYLQTEKSATETDLATVCKICTTDLRVVAVVGREEVQKMCRVTEQIRNANNTFPFMHTKRDSVTKQQVKHPTQTLAIHTHHHIKHKHKRKDGQLE